MNAFIVAAWDGTHAWIQWDSDLDAAFELRIRFGKAAGEWGDWSPLISSRRSWLIYPVYEKVGSAIQVEVRRAGEEEWTRAREAEFEKCVCKFRISSEKKLLHYPEGVKFHTAVDGAVCSYQLLREIEIAPGGSELVDMVALNAEGHAQLDKEGDFLIRPALGVRITNVEPSRDDLKIQDRDFAIISKVKRDGGYAIAFSKPAAIR